MWHMYLVGSIYSTHQTGISHEGRVGGFAKGTKHVVLNGVSSPGFPFCIFTAVLVTNHSHSGLEQILGGHSH